MFNYNSTFQKDFIQPHKINNMDSFIHGYFIGKKDIGLCDELVNHYIHKEKTEFYIQQKFLFWWHNFADIKFPSLSGAKSYLKQCYDRERWLCLNENRAYIHYHCDS
jgi:hypothetical protein